jgi:uncharacterized protein HemX
VGQQARGDWGYKVGLEASAVGFAAASLLVAGHAHAMERMRQERAAREEAAHDAAVAYRLGNADQVEALAMELADELAEAKAEITRLRRTLAQRQAYIDSMRKR